MMETKTLNNSLIEAIKQSLPTPGGLAGTLMEILSIGKEAAYRRLRGEVAFTLAEASLLGKALGISLDQLLSAGTTAGATFHLCMTDPEEETLATYCLTAKDILRNYAAVRQRPGVEYCMASDAIPHSFYLGYEGLSKFLLYQWLYRQNKTGSMKHFADLEVPFEVREVHRQCREAVRALPHSGFIWNELLFLPPVNDIRYFHDLRLVTEKEKNLLKEELLSLVDSLESLAGKGEYENGNKLYFYSSHIHTEATCGFLGADTLKLSFIRLYATHILFSTDQRVFAYQKSRLQSLIKYSTLMSVSGERQRIRFFERQRAFLAEL
ncbi:MAG: hypothetical protein LBD89_06780 [Tannerellaceae bacterium]|jgi:hypothetical protein|nr:hypothetical protein [Tannerellaceae bacterium]